MMCFQRTVIESIVRCINLGICDPNLDHHKMHNLFEGLNLRDTKWVVRGLRMKGFDVHLISNPSEHTIVHKLNIPLIRGPASYFSVKRDGFEYVLIITSGTPYISVIRGK